MAKYRVSGGPRLSTARRSYARGRPAIIQSLMESGMTRREARVLSRIPADDPTIVRMARERSILYARFKNKADPEWTENQLKYHWYKRVSQYYKNNRLYTRRSAGQKKRETSPWEWYRRTLKRMARIVGKTPDEYQRDKSKTPRNKGNVPMQRLRSRDRKEATKAGRVSVSARSDSYLRYAKRQIRTKTQQLGVETSPASRGRLNKEIEMYQADIERKTGKR